MDRALTVHLGTYYTKYQIIFLKFIVGQERRWSMVDRGVFFKVFETKCPSAQTVRRGAGKSDRRLWYFRDQVDRVLFNCYNTCQQKRQ